MKKSVLALAVLGAFAGAASAQSSVTMFGVVDLNVQTVSNNERVYGMGTDGMSSSRLGFRGVEDLGGGLKASFWLEMGIAPDTGRSNTNGNWGSGTENQLIFNRRSTLSLSNQWGELRLGRDYTATFWSWTVFDPFGTNGVGAATNLALGRPPGALAGSTYGTLVRANNMVQYILPAGVFGPGLYGQLQIAAGENSQGNKYWGGRIGYAAGPFDIAGAYGQTDCLNLACTVDLDNWNIGGSWNFGFMKLSGFYSSISGRRFDQWLSGCGSRQLVRRRLGTVRPVELQGQLRRYQRQGSARQQSTPRNGRSAWTTTCRSARRCMPLGRRSTTMAPVHG